MIKIQNMYYPCAARGELELQKYNKISTIRYIHDITSHLAARCTLDGFFEMNTEKYVFRIIFNRATNVVLI